MNTKKKILNIIILIIVLLIIFLGVKTYLNKGNSKIETPISDELPSESINNKNPLIDMQNTENVKIENGEKINTSEKLAQEKSILGLTLKNINLQTKNSISNFSATVENTTLEDFEGSVVMLHFIKNDGSTLATVEAYIPQIKAREKNTITATTTEDITNAIDVKIEM